MNNYRLSTGVIALKSNLLEALCAPEAFSVYAIPAIPLSGRAPRLPNEVM